MFLRQSTPGQVIRIGKFVGTTDANTPQTALTIAASDIKLCKGASTAWVAKNSGGATSQSNGWYHATLDATDSNTIGLLDVEVHVAGALYCHRVYFVLSQAVYDSLLGTSALSTHTAANVKAAVGLAGDGLDTQIAAVLAAIGTRLSSSSYVAAPSAAANASAVRAELATELGRLDVPVGSRLAAEDYEPGEGEYPTPEAVAEAVRANLAAELANLDAPVSTRSAFDPAGDPVKLAADGLAAVLVEDDTDAREALSLCLAMLGGLLSGALSLSPLVKNRAGTATRVALTVDADGNRLSAVHTPYGG